MKKNLDVRTMLRDSTFEPVRLRDTLELLPDGSDYRRYALKDDPWFLVHRGDLRVETLTLDFDGSTARDERNWCGLVVDGNLFVERWVWSEETDGAMGLTVNGAMHAKNVVVGGQEVWVRGNLEVEEVLWGTYNHGALRVEGSLRAALVIQDDYRIETRGGAAVARWLAPVGEMSELTAWLHADCFFDDDDEGGLYRGAAIERLRASKSLLRKRLPMPRHAPLERALTASGLRAVFSLPLLRSGFLSLKVEDADVVLSRGGQVEINHDDRHCLLVSLGAGDRLSMHSLDLVSPKSKPRPLDARAPKAFRALRDLYWPLVVDALEKRMLTSPTELRTIARTLAREVTVARIDKVMSLAMVKTRYRDSHSERSDSGYQRGEWLFAFTLETDETGAAIEVLHECDETLVAPFRQKGDDPPLTGYQFGILEDSRGRRSVGIRYAANTHTDLQALDTQSRTSLYGALDAWRALWSGVFEDNQAYLRGEHVDDDDEPG